MACYMYHNEKMAWLIIINRSWADNIMFAKKCNVAVLQWMLFILIF